MLVTGLLVLALGLAGLTLAAIGWSVVYPDRRIWPPQSYGPQTPIIVWGVTYALFGAIIALGILGWGEASIAGPMRFALGPLLILFGNFGVWFEVIRFGLPQTGGAVGQLKVDGLYRYSRNPQYVADSRYWSAGRCSAHRWWPFPPLSRESWCYWSRHLPKSPGWKISTAKLTGITGRRCVDTYNVCTVELCGRCRSSHKGVVEEA